MFLGLLLPFAACQSPADDSADPASSACTAAAPTWGEGGMDMLPGTNCQGCHSPGSRAEGAVFTVGGTVFAAVDCPEGVAGASVSVTDAAGASLVLMTSAVGNFASADALVAPLRVQVTVGASTREMVEDAPSGACGSCHSPDGVGYVW